MTNGLDFSIDPQELETVVATALDEPSARLGEWQAAPLHGSLDPHNRLLRVAGQAHTRTGDRSWSLVLKIISGTPATDADPTHYRYWRREPFCYQSGLLSDLPGGIAAPRCYRASQHGDAYWLWLEEVRDDPSKPWPLEVYPEVARCLGRFNGAYLAGTPLPDQPWLTRGCLRKYMEMVVPNIRDLPELRKLWYFQRAFADFSDDLLLEAWERRNDFIAALERFPQTFCHQDAFAGNLFWRRGPAGEGQAIAIDWSFAGIAAVGEELAPLVAMADTAMATGSEDAFRFQQACLEGYLAGLAEAGYRANPQQVRFSSLTAGFYRYLFGGNLGELWTWMRDARNHPWVVAMWGLPSLDALLDVAARFNRNSLAVYQEISPLLEQFS